MAKISATLSDKNMREWWSLSYSHLTHLSGLCRNWIKWLKRVNYCKANQAGAPAGVVLLSRVSLLEQINIASNTTWCLPIDLFFFFSSSLICFLFSFPSQSEKRVKAVPIHVEQRTGYISVLHQGCVNSPAFYHHGVWWDLDHLDIPQSIT